MEIFDLLKQLKNIEPDEGYAVVSRRSILAQEPRLAEAHGWSAQRTFWKIIETGAAVALTGFFVMLLTGAFNGHGLTPQYSAIDPGALHAEAQAVDIQIQLANLEYATTSAESTMPAVAAVPAAAKTGGAAVKTNAASGESTAPTASGTPEATTSTTVSIDQALQSLTQ